MQSELQRQRTRFARELAERERRGPVRAPAGALEREERAQEGGADSIWCPTCLEKTDPNPKTGLCNWCDTPLVAVAAGETEAPESEPPPTVGHWANGLYIATQPIPANVVALRPRTPLRPSRRTRQTPPASIETARKAPQPAQLRLPRRRDRRHNHGKPFTDEQIIARAQLWHEITGEWPSKADWTPSKLRARAAKARKRVEDLISRVALYELGDFPSETTIRERPGFGSMNALIVRAGGEPRPPGRQPTTGLGVNLQPKYGPDALENYMQAVQSAMSEGGSELKAALYTLALSAFRWGDRIPGAPDGDV